MACAARFDLTAARFTLKGLSSNVVYLLWVRLQEHRCTTVMNVLRILRYLRIRGLRHLTKELHCLQSWRCGRIAGKVVIAVIALRTHCRRSGDCSLSIADALRVQWRIADAVVVAPTQRRLQWRLQSWRCRRIAGEIVTAVVVLRTHYRRSGYCSLEIADALQAQLWLRLLDADCITLFFLGRHALRQVIH
jgi:hypothetical protein